MLISNQCTVFHQKRLNLLPLIHYQIFQKISCHLQQSIQNLYLLEIGYMVEESLDQK